MEKFNQQLLKQLYVPDTNSHKGQNGKVLVIGGSHLFHAAAFWSLEIASKIVDMVYFSSTPMNNEIAKKLKTIFRNGIIVSRENLEDYILEADSILIGPGLPRPSGEEAGDDNTKILSEKFISKFPEKRWVIDGGSLQTIDPNLIPSNAILTPHPKEFETLFNLPPTKENAKEMAKKYKCIIILKGPIDYVCSPEKTVEISGGNAGMTKGGTGDVLAGLVAALYTKNDAFLAATCASFINKKAGESLEKSVGIYFNASDLISEIPKIMRELI